MLDAGALDRDLGAAIAMQHRGGIERHLRFLAADVHRGDAVLKRRTIGGKGRHSNGDVAVQVDGLVAVGCCCDEWLTGGATEDLTEDLLDGYRAPELSVNLRNRSLGERSDRNVDRAHLRPFEP